MESLRARGTLTYLRGEREKTVDLRSTLVGLSAEDGPRGSVRVRVETRSGERASLRPRALIDAALAEVGRGMPDAVRVRRVAQRHEEDGRLVEPL